MALVKYGITRLLFLPYDIQCIIFNEYTELATREVFEDMIDDLPSQFSSDLPPYTMFVYIDEYPSLYEKLVQEIYTKIESDTIRYNTPKFRHCYIHDLIGNYLNITRLKIMQTEYGIRPSPIRDSETANRHNKLIDIGRFIESSRYHLRSDRTHFTDILRRLDYRELLSFKNICNYNLLTPEDFVDNPRLLQKWNTLGLSCECRVIYDPIKADLFYWYHYPALGIPDIVK